jgi:hypothetical protein
MKKSYVIYDLSFWALLLANIYVIYYYLDHPESLNTVIAIYWLQSVLIGAFNFLDIITLINIKQGSFHERNTGKDMGKGCAGFFFLFHYGFFHAIYFVFLSKDSFGKNQLDWNFVQISFWLLLGSCAIQFIQHKFKQNTKKANLGVMFFLPYARIVPMHLFILIPKFLNITGAMVFLVLKTIADLVMYWVSKKYSFEEDL